MRTILNILDFIVIVGGSCVLAVMLDRENKPRPKPPTITELQEFLGVDADGIIGPKTIRAYEQYSFNQYAARYMTLSGAPEKE